MHASDTLGNTGFGPPSRNPLPAPVDWPKCTLPVSTPVHMDVCGKSTANTCPSVPPQGGPAVIGLLDPLVSRAHRGPGLWPFTRAWGWVWGEQDNMRSAPSGADGGGPSPNPSAGRRHSCPPQRRRVAGNVGFIPEREPERPLPLSRGAAGAQITQWPMAEVVTSHTDPWWAKCLQAVLEWRGLQSPPEEQSEGKLRCQQPR